MNVLNLLKLSLNSIVNRKLRSWLTLLGIVIGVAAVVSIVSISEGAKASIENQMSQFGADLITISPGYSRGMDFGGGPPGMMGDTKKNSSDDDPVLTKKDLMKINTNPNIILASPIVSERVDIYFGSEEISANITGIDPLAAEDIFNISLDSGRMLTTSDTTAIIISYDLANTAFDKPITVGKQITINSNTFNVVGILENGDERSTIYMNYKTSWNITEDIEKDNFSSIKAKVKDLNNITEVVDNITTTLAISRGVYGKDYDFSISSPTSMKERLEEMTSTMTLFLGGIAIISLIVGAIGVANSMFTSVLEKTKEIGILKALGATNKEVLTLFLIESGLFGLIGGILGVLLGLLVSLSFSGIGLQMMPRNMTSSTLVTPSLALASILISTIIGILAGIFPAINASKLRPIEALRYE
jgi:putative ABC transport system permease protein